MEEFTGLKMKSSENVWKRHNADKKEFNLSDYVDISRYHDDVRRLGCEI